MKLLTGTCYGAFTVKGPPNDIYFIIEGPYFDYFTEKASQAPLSDTNKNVKTKLV